MLIRFLQELAACPWAYDRFQILAGHNAVLERLSHAITQLNPNVVVDIGGGTGIVRNLFRADCRYICLDLELPKLRRFCSRNPQGLAVLGDATLMPIIDCGADMLICKSVAHHLSDLMLERALAESQRVLRSGGHLVFLDAVLNRQRLAAQMLWKLDRGSYPRPEEELHEKLEHRFKIIHWEKFAIYHEYVLGIGIRT